jgi:hypothetical protein
LSPSTPTKSASSTPAPTPPATATGITVTSADAFARFYLTAIDHAAATGDVTALRTWADKGCLSCTELIQHYSTVYKAGGSLTGDFRSTNVQVDGVRLNGTKAAEVKLRSTEGKHVLKPSATGAPTTFPGETAKWTLTLANVSGHWVTYEMVQE